MPKPVYIVACQSCSVDKESNNLSIFNVIENVTTTKRPIENVPEGTIPVISPLAMVVVSSWERIPDDAPETEYDFEMFFHWMPSSPGGVEKHDRVATASFVMTMRRHRTNVDVKPGINFAGPGDFTIESRIRRRGSQDAWISQSYSIEVESKNEELDIPIHPPLA